MKVLRRIAGIKAPVVASNPIICQKTGCTVVTDVAEDGSKRQINKLNEKIPITLSEKMSLSQDTFVYRFQLPEDRPLGHYTCQYL